MEIHYHIILDCLDITFNSNPRFATVITDRRYINDRFDVVSITGIGDWLYNKSDNEFVHTYNNPVQRDLMLDRLSMYGVKVKRLHQNIVPR